MFRKTKVRPTHPDQQADTDVVVIGGGHNGLIGATYLARQGKNVTVVEAGNSLGGMTTSGRLIESAPEHTVHPCAVDIIFMRTTSIISDLELHRHGLRTIESDATYAYLHTDGRSLVFWRDPKRTAADIRRFSADDADAYIEFTDLLRAFLAVAVPAMRMDPLRPDPKELRRILTAAIGNRRHVNDLVGLATASAVQIVAERFEHPAVRSALLGLAAGAGPVAADGSAMSFVLVGLLHEYGVSRPAGGMQSLIDAVAASFRESGGKIVTGTPVSEILMESGRAAGVVLADGQTIKSQAVLSTADPHTTLRELVPEGTLDRRTLARVDHIPANATGASPFKVDLALSGRATVPHHTHSDVDLRQPVLLYGTEEDIVSSFESAARGELPGNPFMWACITTAVDPTQAPKGQDSVYLFNPAMPVAPREGWAPLAGPAEKLTIDTAQRFLGGLSDHEIGRWVESPDQMAARTRAWKGSIVHVDISLTRTGPLRPAWGLGGYTTPVEGLFLGGAGTHPGGSVSGLPGKLSSTRVSRYLSKFA
ncbi:NAD(P)/FAD-dependent oxidoreductase [Rhodococcus sp. JVH1]|uniref:phytoene desaturase family protein n=1 Tax=Rhodococcus sp. JVH1 TaxID=745408 RepID=UPI000272133E|nr:NAD(P)/FAD-dependent oxidoreductase [Rhodococcus sp. JVH1]EJI95732.1 FAD dependent oxidoreductase family protein [Rhodococcus sp. JVH1]